jgi:hypothetical protein
VAKEMESACSQAGSNLTTCLQSSCSSPCSTGADGG